MVDKKLDENIINKKIVILDQSLSGASVVKAVLLEAGFKNVKAVANTIQAMDYLQTQPVDIVASELYLGNANAFTLFERIRDNHEFDRLGFMMFATNASKGLVAQAVERDIDAVISKPFTAKAITDIFTDVIKKRFLPNKYLTTIEQAKSFITNLQYDKAIEILTDAVNYDPKPALANYYLAEIMIRKDKIDAAEDYFKAGLNFKPNNLKCLFGLAFCLEKKNNKDEAYKVSKRIISLYPTSQRRLIYSMNYAKEKEIIDDLYFFIGVATNIEFMNDDFKDDLMWKSLELARHYFIKKHDEQKGNTLIATARKMGFNELTVRREIADVLVDAGHFDLADKELTFCKQNKDTSDDLLYIDAKIAFSLKQYLQCIKICQELLNRSYYKLETYLYIAKSYLALSEYDRAEKYSAIALKEMPDSFAARQLLDDISNKKLEKERAEKEKQAASSSDKATENKVETPKKEAAKKETVKKETPKKG